MSLLGGKTPETRRRDEAESVDLSLVLKVGAVLAGVWLALVGIFLGVRKMVGPEQPPEAEAPVAKEQTPGHHEHLGMKPQGHVPEEGSKSAHESADLHPAKIVGGAIVLALTIVISLLALGVLFHLFERAHPGRTSEAAPIVTAADIPPRPGVTPAPGLELLRVRAQEDLHLEHYGWVNAAHTTARIPIERAMALWVQTYSPAEPPASTLVPALVAPPATTNGPPATTLVAPGQTELEMRQEKATDSPHVP